MLRNIRKISPFYNLRKFNRFKSSRAPLADPQTLNNITLKFESKVPLNCITEEKINLTKTKIDKDTISLLEHLSLVDCANKQGIETLEDAILFGDRILHINTDNVEPMYTVLEDRALPLRDDEVTAGNCQKEILRNAALTEEDYFVAPPGNIPLEARDNLLYEDLPTPAKDS